MMKLIRFIVSLSLFLCLYSVDFHNSIASHKIREPSNLIKTGTTIVGVCCSEGIVLGADTRSTGGNLIVSKHTKKIHKISNSIYCCGAGTAGDCVQVTRQVAKVVELSRVERNLAGDFSQFDPIPLVIKSLTNTRPYFKKISYRKPEAVFIVGGVDAAGPSLFQVNSKGSAQKVSYCSLGSGSFNAMSMLEHELCHLSDDSLPLSAATDIVRRAVLSGISNDLGSGSHVDLCVVNDGTVKIWRETSETNTKADQGSGLRESKHILDVAALGRLASRRSRDVLIDRDIHGMELKSVANGDEELSCAVEFIN